MISASHFIVCLSSLLFLLTEKGDSMPYNRAKNATTFHVARRSSFGASFRPAFYGNSVRFASLPRAYNYPLRFAFPSAPNAARISTPARISAPPVSITYGTVYGAEPWSLLSRMGEDEYQIRQFIQRDAREQRIHPNQFDKERFKRAIVQVNNRYRWMHGTEGLVPDSYSEVGAVRWADGLARSGSCLVHELRHGGENLFFFASTEPYLSTPETMAEAVMKSFYIEGRSYMRYAFPARPDPNAYHYTQMLWRGSRRIGVGLSIQALPSGAGPCVPYAYGGYGYSRPQAWMFYVDIRYDPIGNQAYPGNGYTENVLPLVRRV